MTKISAKSKSSIAAHSELYHYTTAGGLYGILKEQKLRATHIDYLNDSAERLGILHNPTLKLIIESQLESVIKNDKVAATLFTTETKKRIVDAVHKSLIEKVMRLEDVYVSSLCVPASSHDDDGLLSQWRGYGEDGGYAIVFDRQQLYKKIEGLWNKFAILVCDMQPVVYFDAAWNGKFHDQINLAIHNLQTRTGKEVQPNPNKEQEMADEILLVMCAFHKNSGFSEESEVRIVVVPDRKGQLKQIERHFRDKEGTLIPYIELFGDTLPIKRIIVGPHRDKEKRANAVRLLLDQLKISADVVTSGLTYIRR